MINQRLKARKSSVTIQGQNAIAVEKKGIQPTANIWDGKNTAKLRMRIAKIARQLDISLVCMLANPAEVSIASKLKASIVPNQRILLI